MQRWFVFRSHILPFSFRIKVRVPLILLALMLLIALVMIINIGVGEYKIAPWDVINTLFGNGTKRQTFVVMSLRLPRTFVAVLVGIGLAVAGSVLQGLTRNPLASPDVIGIGNGASLAAVAVIVLASSAPISVLPVASFAGAAITAFLVYWLAWRDGTSPTRLILVGIGLSAISYAMMQVILAQTAVIRVNQALVWLTGSVYGTTWEHFWTLLPWLAIFLPLTLILSRHLDALNMGDDLARGLGTHVELQRIILLVASVALAGSSVATAGTVGFVGLMAPHIARVLVGSSHGGLLPTSALMGGLIVVLSDLVGRTIAAPIEIPCGVITAAIGAPYFIWLLLRNRNL